MALVYNPDLLSYGSVAVNDTSTLTTDVSSTVISIDTTFFMKIAGGASVPFKFRELGDLTWLSYGNIEVSNFWKTDTDGAITAMRYAAVEYLDGYFYALRWDESENEATLLKMDVDGTELDQVSFDAFNFPFMKVYPGSVAVAHTDATGLIGVVSLVDSASFVVPYSENFLDGTITESTITGFYGGYFHLADQASSIVVCGVTDNASPHAVGIIGVRGLSGGFDIHHGTTEHMSVALSSGLSNSSEMILCGQNASGSKFTTLLYNETAGFTTGVDTELSHRFDGDAIWSIDHYGNDGTFYPCISDGTAGSAVMRLGQKMGGYSTNIEAEYSSPMLVDGSDIWNFVIRFTGTIPSATDTDIAIFKDGTTAKYHLHVKTDGKLAFKTAAGTEVWSSSDSLASMYRAGLDVSSDITFDFKRGLDGSGNIFWAVRVNGSAIDVSVSNPQATLDLGDRVEAPITGVYTGISSQFGNSSVSMPFSSYSDMTTCLFGSCSSAITPAATVHQSYDLSETTDIVQTAIGQATRILGGSVYVTGRRSGIFGGISRLDINLSSRATSNVVEDGNTQMAGTALYDDHLYVPFVSVGSADTAYISIMTTAFELDSYTSVEVQFAPLSSAWYSDSFGNGVVGEGYTGINLIGFGATAVDLGNTPYGIVSFGEGHRDYYSFAETPPTQNVSIYTGQVLGEYIYDEQAGAFIAANPVNTGTHVSEVKTIKLQEALLDYEAYIDTINVYYDIRSAKPVEWVAPDGIVKYATSLLKSKLYFTPDSNYTFDDTSTLLTIQDLGDEAETGSIPSIYDPNNDKTYYVASKQVEAKKVALNGRIGMSIKFRVEAYLGDEGEEKYDDFKVFEINIIPADSVNIGDPHA